MVSETVRQGLCLFTQFLPQTIRDWNELPDSLISSAELSDDCVSKFTSLVRARDKSPPVKPHPPWCSIVSLTFHQ